MYVGLHLFRYLVGIGLGGVLVVAALVLVTRAR